MKNKTLVSLMATGLLVMGTSFAGSGWFAGKSGSDDAIKIGVLNVRELFTKAPQVEAINAKLEKEFKPKQTKLEEQAKTLQTDIDNLKRNSSVMSNEKRQAAQATIAKERAALVQAQQSLRNEAGLAQQQAMQGFLETLNTDVEKFAKQGHYDLILQREGIPYAGEKVDVTEAVLKMLKG